MTASNKEMAKQLADLRETNIDLQKTFETAADNVDEQQVKSRLRTFAEQNKKFATELEREIERTGERVDKEGGSFVGTLHRGFMDLRSKLGGDVDSVIDECVRAERMAIDNYEDALKVDLPPNVQTIVSNQYGELKETRRQLEQFKTKR